MEYEKWLQQLKTGDPVFIEARFKKLELAKVAKTTNNFGALTPFVKKEK
jgi:hypothetical protein